MGRREVGKRGGKLQDGEEVWWNEIGRTVPL